MFGPTVFKLSLTHKVSFGGFVFYSTVRLWSGNREENSLSCFHGLAIAVISHASNLMYCWRYSATDRLWFLFFFFFCFICAGTQLELWNVLREHFQDVSRENICGPTASDLASAKTLCAAGGRPPQGGGLKLLMLKIVKSKLTAQVLVACFSCPTEVLQVSVMSISNSCWVSKPIKKSFPPTMES